MSIDAATAELFVSLAQSGARARLLKGPSIAGWLYDDPQEREYGDCDVLIAPESLADAERALEALGYERDYDDRVLPEWWREHASAWLRHRDGIRVDLHRTLVGVGVSDAECWSALSDGSVTIEVSGVGVPTLEVPARTLHVALHAAQHGPSWGHGLPDLERAVAGLDDVVWRHATELAHRLRAVDAFAAGLGLCEPGGTLAERLQLPAVTSVDARLRAAGAQSSALSFEALASADGLRAQTAMVWRKLAPPAIYMRHWDSRAGRGPLWLAAMYARRAAWILRRTPAGLSAWAATRRTRS
jgi:hypothetical protein